MRPDGKREWKPEEELNRRYVPLHVDEAKEAWNTRYAEVPSIETTKTHIIGGAILPLWQRLKTEKGARLRVVRVTTEDGRRIVGAQIDPSRVGPTLRALGLSRNLKSPEEIFRAVWIEGDIIQLVEGMTIKRAKLHREDRIEVCNPQYYHYQTLRGYSLIEERIAHRVHFYISTEESEGVDQLEAVIRSYPLAKTKAEEDQEEDEPLEFESEQDVAPIIWPAGFSRRRARNLSQRQNHHHRSSQQCSDSEKARRKARFLTLRLPNRGYAASSRKRANAFVPLTTKRGVINGRKIRDSRSVAGL